MNKLCQSGIRCLKPCLSYTTLVPASRAFFAIRMLSVYVAYCQRDSSCDSSLRLGREGRREIDRERSSVIHAEIDFALVATDVPPINQRAQISGFCEGHRVSARMWNFCSVLSIITLSGIALFFYLRCIQSDINIHRFSTEIATEQITCISQFAASYIFI